MDGAVAGQVTGGQDVGIVLNGEAVEIISGGLSVSTVTLPGKPTCLQNPGISNVLKLRGMHRILM